MQVFTRKAVKVLLVMALAVLLFALATACNSNGDDPVATPTPTPQPTATPDAGTPAATPTPEPPQDVVHTDPPRVIRIAAWYEETMGSSARFERPDPAEESDYEMAMQQYNNMRAVEERFNVRIEHVIGGAGDYGTFAEDFFAGQLAGDPIGEIVMLPGHVTMTAYLAGHLTDIATLEFPGSDLFGSRTHITATFEQHGSIWQVSNNDGGDVWGAVGLGVNNELVRRLGLQCPIELYESGQWTWAAMLDIMRTAAAQGYFGISGVINDIGNLILTSNDGTMVTPDMNYGFAQPATMEALEFFSTIVEERLWRYDRYGVTPWEEDDWWRSMTGFAEGDVVFFSTFLWVPDMVGLSDFDFSVLPFPLGPSSTTPNTWAGGLPQRYVIPAGVEDPVLVLQVLEALYAWPGEDRWLVTESVAGGVRGVMLTEEDVQRWVNIAANQRGSDVGFDVHEYRYVFSNFLEDIFHGTRTIAESVEYNRGPRQEMLDNTFR
jgi:hypothetical protein